MEECHQLRNIFGSTRHGPRSIFRAAAKHHNNGRDINFLKPSECRMAAECLQFLRVFRLKDAIQQATRDKVFVDYKRFSFVIKIVNCEEFWDTLFAMIQAIYPIYCILRLSDMKLGGMDKMKYYVCQTDRLLEDGMRNLMKKWSHPRMPTMDFSSCCLSKQDKDFLSGD